jgi:hypothetical protein
LSIPFIATSITNLPRFPLRLPPAENVFQAHAVLTMSAAAAL